MFSLVGGSIHKTKVAYGCVLLLGSASVAGVVSGDSNGQWFTQLGSKISKIFENNAVAGAVAAGGAQQMDFAGAWSWISSTSIEVFNWTIKPTAIAFSQIHKTYESWWKGLKTFFGSLVKPQMYKLLFERFHSKIYNIFSFFLSGGKDRSDFINLFKEGKWRNTLKVGKFLLGVEDQWKGKFKAEPDLLNYLLFNWLDNPQKITGKFKRLSDEIGKENSTIDTASSASSNTFSSGAQDSTYVLTKETLQEYLDLPEGSRETFWLKGWLLEVATKIKTGHKIGEAKTLFSLFGTLWGG